MRSNRNFSFLREYNAVNIVYKDIFLASLLKSTLYLAHGHTFELSYVGWMQARIPGYEDVSFDVLSLLFSIRLYLEIVSYGTEEFAFLEDIPFVNDLYK